MSNQPPLNPDARTECVDMLLEIMGYPRDELFEYPNRADDSREYIARSERTLDKILAVAEPEVNSFDPRGLNRKGWTCGCEPGNYDSCDECQSACNELADFLNRPEVKA